MQGAVALGDDPDRPHRLLALQRRQQEGQGLRRLGDLQAGGEGGAIAAIGDHDQLGGRVRISHLAHLFGQVADRLAAKIEDEDGGGLA